MAYVVVVGERTLKTPLSRTEVKDLIFLAWRYSGFIDLPVDVKGVEKKYTLNINKIIYINE